MAKLAVLFVCLLVIVPLVFAQEGDEEKRTYITYVPASYSGKSPVPLVIALHGAGGTGRFTENLTGFNAIAEEKGFIAVYPDGLDYNWDFGSGIVTPARTLRRVDDVAFLVSLIDTLSETYNVDKDRVLAVGFSNGGSMVYRLACEAPQHFKAVASVAAPMPLVAMQNCSDLPVSVLLIHGTLDPVLSWERVYANDGRLVELSAIDTVLFWGDHNGCDLEQGVSEIVPDSVPDDGSFVIGLVYTHCQPGFQAKIYAVNFGGHTWPGHVIAKPPFDLGKTNMDMDASLVIWEWFEALDKPPALPEATPSPSS